MPENETNANRLDGKVALITGAGGGIGEATAKLFLDLGAKVMLTDRDGARLTEASAQLGSAGVCAMAVADCADESATRSSVAATVERFGGLDILVANAGIEGVLKPIESLSIEDFEEVLRVNVIGIWLSMKFAVPLMKEAGGGAIVALSSVAGAIGFPGMAAYTASKHAVFGLVKVAALELGPARIRVNAVAPGPIDNRMMQSLGDQLGGGDPEGFRAFVEGRVPMGRYGTNEEIAQLVAFLSSDAASYCTGGLYLSDGGYVAA
ncbi:MAG TPA: SDR family NAD(P)-dependent oxidoreductase [Sphingomicrobium sp.]|nr:SDR family NAD(P)-dependent oxidoreductase [Sphingomicrobium sp.]